jgi:spermidine/putrescine transport system ATP-binding protein
VEGRRAGTDGEDLLVDCHGHQVRVPLARVASGEPSALVGVRPEKIRMLSGDAGRSAGGENRLPGGVVVDVSFTGVSTQYLVRMPWGQELTVFEQNLGLQRQAAGATVTLSWDAGHTFLLAGDATAGTEVEDAPLAAGVG